MARIELLDSTSQIDFTHHICCDSVVLLRSHKLPHPRDATEKLLAAIAASYYSRVQADHTTTSHIQISIPSLHRKTCSQ